MRWLLSVTEVDTRTGRRRKAPWIPAQVGGGLLVALGLFGPLGPALVIAVALVALRQEHRPEHHPPAPR